MLGKVISLEAPSLVVWRTAIAALAMALWLSVTARPLLRLPPRLLLPVFGVGALQGLHWVCFFWSIKLSNVSVALAAFATISLFTAFTEPLLERRKIRLNEILCGGIVIVGILLIAGGLHRGYLLGLGVGLIGSLFHAFFPVFNRQLSSAGHSSRTLLLYEMLSGCLVAAAVLPLFEPGRLEMPRPGDWLPLLTLAILCSTVAHTWNIFLLRRLTAYTANLTMNFEPVWGIILGAALFHEYEQLHVPFYLGTALIILANFLDPWLRRRKVHETSGRT